eukprot:1159233-Pelagomonas_calceolata.AAC.5
MALTQLAPVKLTSCCCRARVILAGAIIMLQPALTNDTAQRAQESSSQAKYKAAVQIIPFHSIA